MSRDRAYMGDRFIKLIRVPRHEMEQQLTSTGVSAPPLAQPVQQMQQQQIPIQQQQNPHQRQGFAGAPHAYGNVG